MPRRSRTKHPETSDSYAEAETQALLKILELGERNIQQGKIIPAAEAMQRLRERLRLRTNAARPRKLP
jgi:hypothetical protein